MKKLLVPVACLILITMNSFAVMPNEKVLRSFEETFIGPKEVKWYEHADYCEVSFIQQGMRTTVKYDLNGNFISSLRYCKEQQLPANVLSKLKKKYEGKRVFGVTEITSNEGIIFYIKIEDDKNWFTIKATGSGQMELYEKYRKA